MQFSRISLDSKSLSLTILRSGALLEAIERATWEERGAQARSGEHWGAPVVGVLQGWLLEGAIQKAPALRVRGVGQRPGYAVPAADVVSWSQTKKTPSCMSVLILSME